MVRQFLCLVLIFVNFVLVYAQDIKPFALVIGENRDVVNVYQNRSQPAQLNKDFTLDQINMGIFQACHLPASMQFYNISAEKCILQSQYNGALKNLNPVINGGQGPIYDPRNVGSESFNSKYEIQAVLKQIHFNKNLYNLIQLRDRAWQLMDLDFEQALQNFYHDIDDELLKMQDQPIQKPQDQFQAAASISNSVGYLRLTEHHWLRLLEEVKLYLLQHEQETVSLRLYCLSKVDEANQHFANYKYTFRYLLGTFDSGLHDHQQQKINLSVQALGKDKLDQTYFNIPKHCEQEYIFDIDHLPNFKK